jgi:predicted acyltransferase
VESFQIEKAGHALPAAQMTAVELLNSRHRLVSLDVTRGFAVASMILVVSAGSWDHRYAPLLHADWYGWTLTDMIFPLFLFTAGIAILFSFTVHLGKGVSRGNLAGKALRRAAAILFIGLVLNALPSFDLKTLRIPGILQRIALCYASSALLTLALWRAQPNGFRRMFAAITVVAVGILIVYWAVLAFVPVPGFGPGRFDSLGSLATYIDREVFGLSHLWPYGITPRHGVTYDPEGLLSTLPAIVTVLLGVLCGIWLKCDVGPFRHFLAMALAGVALLFAGLQLDPLFPIAKKIWTDSFVCLSGGFALLVFATAYLLCDVLRLTKWSYVLRVFGANAILAFSLSQIIGAYSDRPWPVRQLGFTALHSFIPSAPAASLAYAALNLALLLAILAPLYQWRIFLRI